MSSFTEWESENLFKKILDTKYPVVDEYGHSFSNMLKVQCYDIYQLELSRFRDLHYGE